MMDLKTKLEEIDRLKQEWDDLQPLEAVRDGKLWEKLRLEWNYNSNHIEGNTLTYGVCSINCVKTIIG